MIFGMLKLLFIVFIVIILLGVAAVLGILHTIKKAHNQLFRMGNNTYDKKRNNNTNTNNDTFVDNRSGQGNNRKIFSKDEGEYVDFEDIK